VERRRRRSTGRGGTSVMRASIAFQRRGEGARREPPMSRAGDPRRLTVRTCRASSGSPNRIGGWILRDRRGTCLRVLVVVGFEAEIAPERHDELGKSTTRDVGAPGQDGRGAQATDRAGDNVPQIREPSRPGETVSRCRVGTSIAARSRGDSERQSDSKGAITSRGEREPWNR
jgi:hypothetical protein